MKPLTEADVLARRARRYRIGRLAPSQRVELMPSDIDDVVQLYRNCIGARDTPWGNSSVTDEDLACANALLDGDIRAEIENGENELNERLLESHNAARGHVGLADVEAALKSMELGKRTYEAIVLQTTVRIFRAKDEQRRRLGFSPSEKPADWLANYNGGDVGLEPAPWESRGV